MNESQNESKIGMDEPEAQKKPELKRVFVLHKRMESTYTDAFTCARVFIDDRGNLLLVDASGELVAVFNGGCWMMAEVRE